MQLPSAPVKRLSDGGILNDLAEARAILIAADQRITDLLVEARCRSGIVFQEAAKAAGMTRRNAYYRIQSDQRNGEM